MMNVSGPAAFTHTHGPITAATFTSGDIEFTKTKFTHEPSQLCSVRLPLTAAEDKGSYLIIWEELSISMQSEMLSLSESHKPKLLPTPPLPGSKGITPALHFPFAGPYHANTQ